MIEPVKPVTNRGSGGVAAAQLLSLQVETLLTLKSSLSRAERRPRNDACRTLVSLLWAILSIICAVDGGIDGGEVAF